MFWNLVQAYFGQVSSALKHLKGMKQTWDIMPQRPTLLALHIWRQQAYAEKPQKIPPVCAAPPLVSR